MILGRTSSGAIKTKSDGGLRAVNCACCVSCPCVTVADESLATLLKNATSGSTASPTVEGDFIFYDDHWYAAFLGPRVYIVEYYFASKQFCMTGDNALNFISAGECECPSGFSCSNVNFTINGTAFLSTQFTEFGSPVDAPIFTFS